MQEFSEKKEDLVNKLKSNADRGLSAQQVTTNRQQYGANRLSKEKNASIWRKLFDAASEPMLIMLIVAGFIALSVNIIRSATGGTADYLEVIGIFVAIALSVVITVVMEGRSAKAFEELSKLSDHVIVTAIRDQQKISLNQDELVVGDIILLATGDKIPADGRLLESVGLTADESALTGESRPSKKDASLVLDEHTPLAERKNMLYMGNFITNGYSKMIVTAVGDATEFGQIARELMISKQTTTPLQEKLARLGKIITILGVAAAAIVFITQVISFYLHDTLTLYNVMESFITSIVLIVAAVPEGLPTIVAISLSINIIKLSRQNALVKKMIASETIGSVNVICSDKTGTLTENKMTVVAFYDATWHTKPAEMSSVFLAHNIALNTTADIEADGTFIGNPTECALLNFYEQSQARKMSGRTYKEERADHHTLQAFPFSSELKHMTTISKVDGKIISYVKGSPESVFAMTGLTATQKAEINRFITATQEEAKRVIAFAHKELASMGDFEEAEAHDKLESNMIFDGFVAIADPLRQDVITAVKSCQQAGIALKILTGDNILTAKAIAKELNIVSEKSLVLEARDVLAMSDEELTQKLPHIVVIARSTPKVKMRIVQLLKASGDVVAVTGDGINDAPAIKNADVGIAMGISGTEVSKEASDIVLLDDSFSTIVKAIEWGRNIFENFKRFITFQLTVNVASVIVVLVSILMGFKAPFTALDLLWINIIMDGPPALTLGLEPNYADLMNRKPVSRNQNILSRSMMTKIFITGIYMSIVFLVQHETNFMHVGAKQEATVLFTLFTLFQLFNAFNCRELHAESIFKHLFANKLMLVVVGCTFVLQILIIQFGGAFFGTVPLDLLTWGKIFGLSFTVIIWSEVLKLLYRLFSK